jgi:hypothetical protein
MNWYTRQESVEKPPKASKNNWYRLAMPLPTDYLRNLHDPDLRKNVPPERELIVYHGTSTKKLVYILSHGYLDPDISSQDEYRSYNGSSKGIFVTTSAKGFTGAELYAHHSSSMQGADEGQSGDGSDPVVLELIVPIGWIQQDPDDTRIDLETGQMNDLGKMQGVVQRKISIKRIKNIYLKNEQIAEYHGLNSQEFFDQGMTEWMPIGIFLDRVIKLIKKGVDLPEEYQQMAQMIRPRGLSRSDAYEDVEHKIVEGLMMLIATFFEPNLVSYDQILSWVFQNKINYYDNAAKVIESFFVQFVGQEDWEKMVEEQMPDYYRPKDYEPLIAYLKRAGSY